MVIISKANMPSARETEGLLGGCGRGRDSEVQSGRNKIKFKIAWGAHILLSVAILVIGIIANGEDRKLVKAGNPARIPADCNKLYVNVLVDSIDDDEATICCTSGSDDHPLLCGSLLSNLPLATRLTKFPDAWLLPLFPLFIRYISDAAHTIARETSHFTVFSKKSFFRLALYVAVLFLRGFVLYLGVNAIEGAIIKDAPESCWHDDWMKEGTSSCRGYEFDYSDHVVLYFGQMLALPLAEVMHSLYIDQFWGESTKVCGTRTWYPKILVVVLVYLYFITFLNAYLTASYFHTGLEIAVGYFVSLLIQIPLYMLQATHVIPAVSDVFFG